MWLHWEDRERDSFPSLTQSPNVRFQFEWKARTMHILAVLAKCGPASHWLITIFTEMV